MDLFFQRSTYRTKAGIPGHSNLPRVQTPLGVLLTRFVLNGAPVPLGAKQARVLEGGVLLFKYQTSAVRAELVTVAIEDGSTGDRVQSCVGSFGGSPRGPTSRV